MCDEADCDLLAEQQAERVEWEREQPYWLALFDAEPEGDAE